MDVTCELPPVMVVPPVQVQEPASPKTAKALKLGMTSQAGGTSALGEVPVTGGLDDCDPNPPIPLPLLGKGIAHQRRMTFPAKGVDQDGEGSRGSLGDENQPAPDNTPLVGCEFAIGE